MKVGSELAYFLRTQAFRMSSLLPGQISYIRTDPGGCEHIIETVPGAAEPVFFTC